MCDIDIRSWQANIYNRTNDPGTCLWCGRKLRKCGDNRGDYGDNAFCGLRCGYMFAVSMARCGRRLVRHHERDEPGANTYKYPACPTCGKKMRVASDSSQLYLDCPAGSNSTDETCDDSEWRPGTVTTTVRDDGGRDTVYQLKGP